MSGEIHVGGITGRNNNRVIYCYATGAVSGTSEGKARVDAGGITGYGSSVQYCVALNSGVSASTSGTVHLGRVSGYNSGNYNYALSTLVPALTGTQQTNSNTDATTDDASKTGGGTITTATLTQEWFTTAANWDTAAWAFGSTEAAPWVWDSANSRPKLWFVTE
jgi:hypothetical protein